MGEGSPYAPCAVAGVAVPEDCCGRGSAGLGTATAAAAALWELLAAAKAAAPLTLMERRTAAAAAAAEGPLAAVPSELGDWGTAPEKEMVRPTAGGKRAAGVRAIGSGIGARGSRTDEGLPR